MNLPLHFGIPPAGDGRQNKQIRLWAVTVRVYCTTAGQLVWTLTTSQVHIQQYSKCHHWHYTLLCQQGYHPNITVTLNMTLHHHMCNFHHRPQWATPTTSALHCLKPNADIRCLPISWWSQLQFKIAVESMLRPNSLYNASLPRNSPINFLGHMRSWHSLAPFHHPTTPYSPLSHTPAVPCFMLEPTYPNPNPDHIQPLHCNHDGWWTWVENLWNSWLQDQ